MSEPTSTPAAPAAATPAAAPAAAEKKSSLLSNILGLVKPGEVDVKPNADDEAKAKAKANAEADARAKADAEANAAAEAKAKADAEAKAKAAQPAVEPKKVPVKRKEASPAVAAPVATLTAEEARKIAAEEAAKAVTKPAPVPVEPDDEDLTVAEKEELELAKLAEAKDPSRKGLPDKFRKFYVEQKKFLEGRLAAEGADYNPDEDPEYKKFVSKHEPKLSATERKTLREEKIANEASVRATKAAEEKLTPELERLRLKTLELEHRPKITERMGRYSGELVTGMPEDVVEFFNKNGQDVQKTREAFPTEFDIIVQSINGAGTLAEEALALRRGIVKFDPKNEKHSFLDGFLDRQAKALLSSTNAELRVRDGKTFVHPYEFTDAVAEKHWTFDDEDILGALREVAQREAKHRVKIHREGVKAAVEAEKKRSAAPTGASATPPEAPASSPSSRTPPSVAPGAAAPAAKKGSVLSSLLNLS